MLIKLIRSFSAAHRLPHYDGPCHDLHGHTWKAVFIIEGPVQQDGMVCDFKVIKKLLDDQLPDHRFLNDEVENPTAENLAQYLFKKAGEKLAEKGLKLKTLEIWESENAAAIMEG
ncbi:MAG: 6-carboxytetrahydropterin synthase [Elusimicrobia bacterium]|nr:6-carboxytetrahydropterin synthase [Elusimicrobiota bacterium]MDD7501672.1 6-carboxytetrahydropterin synthase [Elusimicrobiota bacterium]MDY5729781.1 6-carboxytetrahydropterin synthase [Elusimicrobiaceae bacterium]